MFGRKKKETLDNGLPAPAEASVAPAPDAAPAQPQAEVHLPPVESTMLKAALGFSGARNIENAINDAMQMAEAYQQNALQQMAAATPAEDPLDRIKKLNDLRQAGALTDAEFEAQKKKILGEV